MTKSLRILLVDDDPLILSTLGSYFRERGHQIITAANCRDALRLNNEAVDVALLDLMLPDGNGLELLKAFRMKYRDQLMIMISGAATIVDAVAGVKAGAADFLEKPVSPEKVEITIRNALKLSSLEKKVKDIVHSEITHYALIGETAAIKNVRAQIEEVCQTDSSVLLLGESGTGKEVVARLVHLKSQRGAEPFIAVNAAAIPSELLESEMFGHERGAFTGAIQRRIGKVEQASGGTLFLDEIAEMPPTMQAKLLRVLEEHTIERLGAERPISVDFRLISATNRDLDDHLRDGRFRRDLYFRINVFTIRLPSLREISEDIEAIAFYHLRQLSLKMGKGELQLAPEIVSALKQYHFPGNVRELRNIIEHLLITSKGKTLSLIHLQGLLTHSIPSIDRRGLSLKEATARFELEYIQLTLRRCAGNISKAADSLGLDRSYLYRKLKSLGYDEIPQ